MIRYFRHAERLGRGSKNYQVLISKAKGQFIAHLDGDDFWLPGKLRRQIEILDAMSQLVAVYSNAIVVDDSGNLRGRFNKPLPLTFDLGFLLRKGNFLCHASLVYRSTFKSAVEKLTPPFLDYQIHLLLAQHGLLGYLNTDLVGYRVSATSISVITGDDVRYHYWQAIKSIQKLPVLHHDIGSAMAQFLAISLWNMMAGVNFSSIKPLWKKVFNEIPISRYRFYTLLFVFLAEHVLFKARNFMSTYILCNPLKIYFRR